ncbi:probable G-protein coupled receptor 139 [Hemiscyllium ocellatum]|uniref:probable G-protein coupled receptor 139 n=1 Tax=Hemiscyllium ocellatum TaxID=170820 RepID=UPI0029661F9B|nr:probable G-protein coupled receptor 139 [Hemiscyllium ocellatum]
MAVADLLVVMFDVIFYEINDIYFSYSFLNYTPIWSLNIALLCTAIDCSVWVTVAFTFDRFIAICCQTLRKKYCNERTASIIIATTYALSFVENIPIYFENEHLEMIDNATWFCNVKSSLFNVPLWVAYCFVDFTLTPFVPFVLIALLNAFTIKHVVQSNRVRKKLQRSEREDHNDPEMDNRRKSIMLLLAISGCFILLWTVTFVHSVCTQFVGIPFFSRNYNDPFAIMEHTGYMLQCLSSCTNTFIYAVAQVKFRRELMAIIEYPFVLTKSMISQNG